MPSLHPISMRYRPHVHQISPWFILSGSLFTALFLTALSSYLLPSPPFNQNNKPIPIPNHIIDTSVTRGGPEPGPELDRIVHLDTNDNTAAPRHRHVIQQHVTLTAAAATATVTATSSAAKATLLSSPTASAAIDILSTANTNLVARSPQPQPQPEPEPRLPRSSAREFLYTSSVW